MPYANFWARLAAFLLDSVILYIPNVIIGTIVNSVFGVNQVVSQIEAAGDPIDDSQAAELLTQFMSTIFPALLVSSLIATLIAWLYYALMESSARQATLGKMALNLAVTDINGDRISFGRATGRYFSKAFLSSIFLIGYIMAAFTAKKQGLHDLIAKTLVVKQR